MEDILTQLGILNLNDYISVINHDSFQKIKVEDVRKILLEHDMNDKNLVDTEESKFEYINLILMLKYGKFIDDIKSIESDQIGYRLELMP